MLRRLFITALLTLPAVAYADAIETLLDQYRQEGAAQFSAVQGQTRWEMVRPAKADYGKRSCNDCHGADLRQVGKHAKTGKRIEPMARSVNPERLTDMAKIEKWFRRNCKWTLGRVCTPQEKGDFLVFLRQQ
ncbi:MAG: DUF1924 domain-containing protein [Candidatus Thiodiazotropha sp.]